MSKIINQTSFKTGEVDVTNWKRTDQEELYLSAAQSLKNCEIGTTQLCKKRKGSKFLYDVTAYATANSRMYEFVDQNRNYYVVLSGNYAFYIFASPGEPDEVVTVDGSQVITIDGDLVVAGESGMTLVQSVPTPYSISELPAIDYSQDDTVLILTHPSHPPARIYVENYSPLTFAYQVLNIVVYPSYDFGLINYNDFTVSASIAGDVLTFSFTGLSSDPGFTSAWVGGQIISIGATDATPEGYANITAVSAFSAGTVTFTASIQTPFGSPLAIKGSQYSIRQPAFSAALGYPAKVFYYQNRLWFASTATLPTTIFGSQLNAPLNFDVGVGRDTDAIIYKIGQSNSGRILWINGGKQLEIYTENFEFVIPQTQDSTLVPSSFSINMQSAYGSSPYFKPISYINDSYFIAKTGKAFINYHFDGVGQAYTSSNISAVSSHLIKAPINRALLRGTDSSQDNFIYLVNYDNTLTAFQFASEYKLAAFTPLDFLNTNAEQETNLIQLFDACSVNNRIMLLKDYSLTNKMTIEVFDEDIKMDSFADYDLQSSGEITGLSLYNGYYMQTLFNSQDYGAGTVVDGVLTIDNPEEETGIIQVGLPYEIEIIPMYLFSGSSEVHFYKNISKIYVDYYNSLNFYINGTFVPYQTFASIQAGEGITPQTGTATVYPVRGWNQFDTFSITQSSPFDLQILAISYHIKSATI